MPRAFFYSYLSLKSDKSDKGDKADGMRVFRVSLCHPCHSYWWGDVVLERPASTRDRQRAAQRRYRARQREGAMVGADGLASNRAQGGSAFDLRITF